MKARVLPHKDDFKLYACSSDCALEKLILFSKDYDYLLHTCHRIIQEWIEDDDAPNMVLQIRHHDEVVYIQGLHRDF